MPVSWGHSNNKAVSSPSSGGRKPQPWGWAPRGAAPTGPQHGVTTSPGLLGWPTCHPDLCARPPCLSLSQDARCLSACITRGDLISRSSITRYLLPDKASLRLPWTGLRSSVPPATGREGAARQDPPSPARLTPGSGPDPPPQSSPHLSKDPVLGSGTPVGAVRHPPRLRPGPVGRREPPPAARWVHQGPGRRASRRAGGARAAPARRSPSAAISWASFPSSLIEVRCVERSALLLEGNRSACSVSLEL